LIENNEISEEVPVQHQTERLAARQRCVVQATGYKQGCRLVRFENEPTWNIVMLFNDKFLIFSIKARLSDLERQCSAVAALTVGVVLHSAPTNLSPLARCLNKTYTTSRTKL